MERWYGGVMVTGGTGYSCDGVVNPMVDGDGDGWSNVGDDFPNEGTQWSDSDGDNFGDNPGGVNPDSCTSVVGTSSSDRYGCPDSDSDSWSDPDGGWTAFQGADACASTWGN